MSALRPLLCGLCILMLVGCAGRGDAPGARPFAQARVSEVQACAIGYDLAREIHARVSLRRTVLLAPRRASACERHALDYLRRAGFRIDETGQGGARLSIVLTRNDPETVSAVAQIGTGLRIARPYRPVATGVIAAGPVSIQHLDPDSYSTREGST